MAGDLTVLIAERRREVAASRAELDHLDIELAAVERALRTGETRATLCIRKKEQDAALRMPVA